MKWLAPILVLGCLASPAAAQQCGQAEGAKYEALAESARIMLQALSQTQLSTGNYPATMRDTIDIHNEQQLALVMQLRAYIRATEDIAYALRVCARPE